ncbi:MAG: hypothetical protein CMQ54_05485 [Gammaproteobacteria bacterium]|nr:hypothetical protein [Gammaproteobacteria bacterium]
MLNDFHWLRPEWFLLIPIIFVAIYFLAFKQLGSSNWSSVIDHELIPYVLSQNPVRDKDARWILMTIACLIAIIALAGPSWKRIEQPAFRLDQSLVIALDLSLSMDTQDLIPSRLQRAKLKILDILERRKSGQTALVVYSANAFTVTPLTTDVDTIASLVSSLDTDIMPSRGSYPEVAINKSKQLLEQANVSIGKILLITDGGSSPEATSVAQSLKGKGFTLSILGVGTVDGAPIPLKMGGFVTDNRGNIAIPKLEEKGLQILAETGGGDYARITDNDSDLNKLLFLDSLKANVSHGDLLATDQWRDEGPWLLLCLIPLASLAFRRGWMIVLIFFITPFPLAQASIWNDLWLTKDQQAKKELDDGNPSIAANLFKSREWKAIAEYEAGNYAESASIFSENNNARDLYNLGNAMALQGNLDTAIEAYQKSLDLQSDNEDATFNLELLKKVKEKEAQQNQNDDNQKAQNSEEDQSKSNGQSSENRKKGDSENSSSSSEDKSEKNNNSSSNEFNGNSEKDIQALKEELQRASQENNLNEDVEHQSEVELAEIRKQQEQDQAIEQWLRRVPDDPGGLLRRKFRYQYQRSGKDQDGNNVWPDNEAQPW